MHKSAYATSCRKGRSAQRTRRGSLLVEMVVCTVLLSVVAAVLVPGIHAVHEQRKATRFDTMVLIELNNQAAKLKTSGAGADPELSGWFLKRYPECEISTDVIEGDSATRKGMQAVRVTVTRTSVDGQSGLARSLVVWVSSKETDQ